MRVSRTYENDEIVGVHVEPGGEFELAGGAGMVLVALDAAARNLERIDHYQHPNGEVVEHAYCRWDDCTWNGVCPHSGTCPLAEETP